MKAPERAGRLFIVDAHAYLHRAYHALPPLKTKSGEPVGALYGFARMLLSLMRRERPQFLAVCFDAPGPTHRHEKFAEYKATRKETDDDLKCQLALARPFAKAMGLACFELPGYEADDLMATLTSNFAGRGVDVVLVTTDKDAMQLVDDHVQVLHEGKGEYFNAQKVEAKFGIRPGQIVDYLALIGDAVDNVPGVQGIGPVGACKLLKRFGTAQKVLEAAKKGDEEISTKTREFLLASTDSLLSSRDLVTLHAQAPISVKLPECKVGQPQEETLLPFLQRFEFFSLMRELFPKAQASPAAAEQAPDKPLEPIKAEEWFKAAAKTKRISLALCRTAPEAQSEELFTHARDRICLAVGLPDGKNAWLDRDAIDKHEAAFRRLIESDCEKVAHDAKPVLLALREWGFSPKGPWFDAMLAAYCLNPSAGKYEFDPVEDEEARACALRQASTIWNAAARLRQSLEQEKLWPLFAELELPLIDVLAEMEQEGVGLDRPYLEKLKLEFGGRVAELKREIDGLAGRDVNLNSPKQLAQLFFEELKLPVIQKTPKGGVSTGEETLKALSGLHPIPLKMLEYREVSKLKSTYIDALLERIDGGTRRVHTRFNQAGTATGRLSSVEPNLQNIPIRSALGQKIRRAFVPREGWVLLSADYSQIDLRVLAHLSGDPELVCAFNNGEDVHLKTACEIFSVSPKEVDAEMRRRAKAVNFGIVYGQTAHGLSQELGIPIGKAKDYIQRYFEKYAGVKTWSQATLETARREGKVRTILGRVRYVPDINAKNTAVRLFNERVAVNTPIQGSSADIIKRAMVEIHKKRDKWKSVPVLQVHDELLFECPKNEAAAFGKWAKKEMETAVELKVPLIVDLKTGDNWQDMKRSA